MMATLRRGLQNRRKALAFAGFSALVLSVLRSSRGILIPLWGGRIGLSSTEIGFAISLSAVAEILLIGPSGYLADRFGRKAPYGKWKANLKRTGQQIGPIDMLLAGQALSNNLIMVTNNTREFSRITDLTIEDWTL